MDETTYIDALQVELYSQSNWPTLRTALTLLKRGDARGIQLISRLGGAGESESDADDQPASNDDDRQAPRLRDCFV